MGFEQPGAFVARVPFHQERPKKEVGTGALNGSEDVINTSVMSQEAEPKTESEPMELMQTLPERNRAVLERVLSTVGLPAVDDLAGFVDVYQEDNQGNKALEEALIDFGYFVIPTDDINQQFEAEQSAEVEARKIAKLLQ